MNVRYETTRMRTKQIHASFAPAKARSPPHLPTPSRAFPPSLPIQTTPHQVRSRSSACTHLRNTLCIGHASSPGRTHVGRTARAPLRPRQSLRSRAMMNRCPCPARSSGRVHSQFSAQRCSRRCSMSRSHPWGQTTGSGSRQATSRSVSRCSHFIRRATDGRGASTECLLLLCEVPVHWRRWSRNGLRARPVVRL